jgi:hypothetical protein
MEHRTGFGPYVHHLLFELDYRIVEIFNGIAFALIGVVLAFEIDQIFHFFQFTDGITPYLGGVFALLGAAGLVTYFRGPIRIRMGIAFASMFMWAFLLVVLSEYPVRPVLIVLVLELTLFTMWTYIRLTLDRRAERLLDPRDPYHGN